MTSFFCLFVFYLLGTTYSAGIESGFQFVREITISDTSPGGDLDILEGGCLSDSFRVWVHYPGLPASGSVTFLMVYGKATDTGNSLAFTNGAFYYFSKGGCGAAGWELASYSGSFYHDTFIVGGNTDFYIGGETTGHVAHAGIDTGPNSDALGGNSFNIYSEKVTCETAHGVGTCNNQVAYMHSHMYLSYVVHHAAQSDAYPPHIKMYLCKSTSSQSPIEPFDAETLWIFKSASFPTGWSSFTDVNNFNRFIMASDAYGGLSGNTEHSHTVTASHFQVVGSKYCNDGVQYGQKYSHSHALSHPTDAASSLPKFHDVIFGQPTTGSGHSPPADFQVVYMVGYGADPPLGYSLLDLDTFYLRGANVFSPTGIANGPHTHVLDADAVVTNNNDFVTYVIFFLTLFFRCAPGGSATDVRDHTHGQYDTTNSKTNFPQYATLQFFERTISPPTSISNDEHFICDGAPGTDPLSCGSNDCIGYNQCDVCSLGQWLNVDTCENCPAGNYGDDGLTCTACSSPGTTTTPGSAVSANDCFCQEGFGGGKDSCSQCGVDQYSSELDGEKMRVCGSCDHANAHSSVGSHGVSSCVCDEGYAGGSNVCNICSAGSYSSELDGNDRTCEPCDHPFADSASAGMHGISSCVCEEGYSGGSNVCSICSAGTYSSELSGGLRTCEPCDHPNANSASAGMHGISSCACQEGYGGGDNVCNICSAGTYSTDLDVDLDRTCASCDHPNADSASAGMHGISSCACQEGYGGGDNVCNICGAGSYSTDLDGDLDRACLLCDHDHATSASAGMHDISSCECEEGYSGGNNVCSECSSGTYSSELSGGIRSCEPCDHPNADSASAGMHGISSCACQEGYGGGDNDCTICSAGSYSTGLDGSLDRTCASCDHPNADSASAGMHGISSCVCEEGYSGGNNVCNICSAGSYSSELSGGLRTCEPCDHPFADSASAGMHGISSCACQEGYGGGDNVCSICGSGSYSTDLDGNLDRACSPCDHDHASSASAGMHGISSCVCEEGYSGGSNVCSICSAGTYSSDLSGGLRSCEPCDHPNANSASAGMHGISSCACQEGYGGGDNLCSVCGAGSYSTGLDGDLDRTCSLCDHDHATSASPGMHGISSCECEEGYSGGSNVCSECSAGTYSSELSGGIRTCEPCDHPNADSDSAGMHGISSCVCQEGYGGGDNACSICDAGSYSTGLDGSLDRTCASCDHDHATSASAGMHGISSCVCEEGYSGGNNVCSECSAGFYSSELSGGLRSCEPCDHPNADSASAGMHGVSSCACQEGYGGGDNVCGICSAGTYSTDLDGDLDRTCASCDHPNADSASAGMHGISSCVCEEGYSGGNNVCNICSAGKYSSEPDVISPFLRTCEDCTLPATSSAGSHGISSCVCPEGYSGGSNVCSICSAGFYSSELSGGLRSCEPCDHPNSNSASAGMHGISSCACQEGYEGGDNACSICSAGSYSSDLDGDLDRTCLLCDHDHATSASAGMHGISSCVCEEGYSGGDNVCSICSAGFYSSELSGGLRSCEPCDHPNADSASAGMHGISSCVCEEGYSGGNNVCSECSAGTYSSELSGGLRTCEPCDHPNADSASAGMHGISSCACQEGYGGGDNVCSICGAGSYSTDLDGDLDRSCSLCDHDHATSASAGMHGISSCVCEEGYSGGSNVCSICSAGKYSSDPDVISPFLRTCEDCTLPATSSAGSHGISSCVCPEGYSGGNNVCEECLAGTYSSELESNNRVCSPCDHVHATSPSNGMHGITSCVCEEGYGGGDNVCTLCLAGSYSSELDGSSDRSCEPCDHPNADSASAGMHGVSSCACEEGYGGGDNVCTICSAGSYSTELDGNLDRTCAPCDHEHATSTSAGLHGISSCVCAEGYGGGDNVCNICSAGSYSSELDGNNDRSCLLCDHPNADSVSEGMHGISSCVCQEGYEGGNNVCTLCLAGTYSTDLDESGYRVCAPCSDPHATSDSNGMHGNYSCVCEEGYGGGDNLCTKCQAGTYSSEVDGENDRSCLECSDSNSNSIEGSHSISSCVCNEGCGGGSDSCHVCNEGHFSSEVDGFGNRMCLECPGGTFQEGTGQSGCEDCPSGTWSESTGATTSSTCVECPQGSWSDALGLSSTCTQCEAGTWSNATGATSVDTCINCESGTWSDTVGAPSRDACVKCGAGKWSSALGATSSDSCVSCEAGSWSDTIGASSSDYCTLCQAGTWSEETGASSCIPCDAGTASDAIGATMESTCAQCGAGYWSSQGSSSCEECPAGTFSAALGATSNETCQNCEDGTFSSSGSSECSVCDPGTYESGSSCLQCEPGNWCFDGTSRSCPMSGQFSPIGSFSEHNCSCCPVGSTINDVLDGCDSCPEGSRTVPVDSGECPTTCEQCGVELYALGDECLECPQGFTCNGGVKTICPDGKYEENNECHLCRPGSWCQSGISNDCGFRKFSLEASVSESNCTLCSSDTVLSSEKDDCVCCEAGFGVFTENNTCVECGGGEVSSPCNPCEVCEIGTFAEENECLECPEGFVCLDGVKVVEETWQCGDHLNTDDSVCSSAGDCLKSLEDEGTYCDCWEGSIGEYCEVTHPLPVISISPDHQIVGACSRGKVSATVWQGHEVELFWDSNITSYEFNSLPSHEFPVDIPEGVYYVRVWPEDLWGRGESEIEEVIATKVSYDLPMAEISGPKILYAFPNTRDIVLEGVGSTDCPTASEEYSYSWKQAEPMESLVDFSNIEKDANTLALSNGFPLMDESYVIQFSVGSQMGSSEASVIIVVIVRDLVAKTNDSSRSIPAGSWTSVSGEPSFDPEESETDEEFVWVLTGPGEQEKVFTDQEVVSFYLEDVGHYQLEMSYSKGERTSNVVLQYEVFTPTDDYVPTVWVDQFSLPLNPENKISIQGYLEEHENIEKSLSVTFQWECDGLTPLEDYVLFEECVESLALTLKPGVLSEDTLCTLYAFYQETSTFATTLLSLDSSGPTGGTVSIYPKENKVLDNFHVAFSGWNDDSPPLKYRLEYNHCITQQEKIVRDWDIENHFSFVISSQGCRQNDYEIELKAMVKDYFGSITTRIVKLKVFPVAYGDIVEFLQYSIDLLQSPVSRMESYQDFLSDRIGIIFSVYNLRAPDCTSLSLQEMLCITREECENTDIVAMVPDLVSTFQIAALEFIEENLASFDHDTIISSIELLKLHGEVLAITKDSDVLNATLSFLNMFFESGYSDNLGINDLDGFWKIIGMLIQFGETLGDKNVFYRHIHAILSIFVEEISLFEPNVYLPTSTNNDDSSKVFYSYIKEYSSMYIENKKLRLDGKSISIGDVSVDIPSEIVADNAMFDVFSTFGFGLNGSSVKVAVFFSKEDNGIALNDPLTIRFPMLKVDENGNKLKSNKKSIKCVQEDLEGNIETCSPTEDPEIDDNLIVVCKCERINRLYSIEYMQEKMKQFSGSNNAVITVSIVLPILLAIAILLVVVSVIVVLYVKKYRKKKLMIKDVRLSSSDDDEEEEDQDSIELQNIPEDQHSNSTIEKEGEEWDDGYVENFSSDEDDDDGYSSYEVQPAILERKDHEKSDSKIVDETATSELERGNKNVKEKDHVADATEIEQEKDSKKLEDGDCASQEESSELNKKAEDDGFSSLEIELETSSRELLDEEQEVPSGSKKKERKEEEESMRGGDLSEEEGDENASFEEIGAGSLSEDEKKPTEFEKKDLELEGNKKEEKEPTEISRLLHCINTPGCSSLPEAEESHEPSSVAETNIPNEQQLEKVEADDCDKPGAIDGSIKDSTTFDSTSQSLPHAEIRRIQRQRMNSAPIHSPKEELGGGNSAIRKSFTESNTSRNAGIPKRKSRVRSGRGLPRSFSQSSYPESLGRSVIDKNDEGTREKFHSRKKPPSGSRFSRSSSKRLMKESLTRSLSRKSIQKKLDTNNENYDKLSKKLFEEKRKVREEEQQKLMASRSLPNVQDASAVLNTSNSSFLEMLEERRRLGERQFQLDYEGIDVSGVDKVVDARNLWYLKMKKMREMERAEKVKLPKYEKKKYDKVESKLAQYLNRKSVLQ